MPDYSSLLGMMEYEAETLPELFGQWYQDVDPIWTEQLSPAFKLAETALGELPGLRGGMLGQLRGGLQQRGIAAGRALEARRAGAGFAGAGAIERFGRMGRRGLEREYGRGMYGIEQDIAKQEAGILGTLAGKTESFLEMLGLSGVARRTTGYYDPGAPGVGDIIIPGGDDDVVDGYGGRDPDYAAWRDYRAEGGTLGYQDWLSYAGRLY